MSIYTSVNIPKTQTNNYNKKTPPSPYKYIIKNIYNTIELSSYLNTQQMPKIQYNWLAISKEFIQGIYTKDVITGETKHHFPTQPELALKYGVSIEAIRTHSQKDKWYLSRSQFKRKLRLKSSEVNIEDLLGEGVRFDSKYLTILEQVSILISEFLKPHIELLEKPDELNNVVDVVEDLPPITIKDLKEITAIIKDSHLTVRSILGEQNTQSLIDDIKDDMLASRRNKELSKTRLEELSKQLQETSKLKKELEIRRKQIEQQLLTGDNKKQIG